MLGQSRLHLRYLLRLLLFLTAREPGRRRWELITSSFIPLFLRGGLVILVYKTFLRVIIVEQEGSRFYDILYHSFVVMVIGEAI
jgi:hypothetical protein